MMDIKKMAKSGQMEAVKIMAKDLVRTRAFIKKFILMKANIQGIALKIQTLKSQAAMANAMKGNARCVCGCVCVCVCVCVCGVCSFVDICWWSVTACMYVCVSIITEFVCLLGVTKALKRMNTKMNLPQLQKIMMEFERESEIMDLKEETISDTIDDVLGEGDEEEVRCGLRGVVSLCVCLFLGDRSDCESGVG